MATQTPGASPLFTSGQPRQQYGRDWGNYVSVVTMPNGSGNILAASEFKLEAGDRCYLSLAGGECEYLCVSPGAATLGNAVWVPSSGQGPWSSVLYVDQVRGSDTTGQRGNANRPFATIQAAINAAQVNDAVECAQQSFLLTAPLTRPAALTSFSILGTKTGQTPNVAGGSGTVLQQTTAGQAVIDLSTNLGLNKCAIYNLTLRTAASGDNAILADGSVAGYAPNAYLTGGLIVRDAFVAQGQWTLKNVFNCRLEKVEFYFSLLLTFNTCAIIVMESVLAPFVAVALTFDADSVGAPTTQSGLSVGACSKVGGGAVAAFCTMSKQAMLIVDETSQIGGIKGNGLAPNAGATMFPKLVCGGAVGGGNSGVIDFASAGAELPDTATVLTWNLMGARLWCGPWGNFTTQSSIVTSKFKVAGAAANFQTVKLDLTAAFPGCTFTADAAIHMTARGSDFPQAVYTTPGATGDIIPPILTGTISLAAGGTVVQTWVGLGYAGLVRVGAAPDYAAINSIVQGADAVISAVSTTGFTTIATAQAGNTGARWKAQWK